MYPNLFAPVKVGGVIFRNRILASPTGWVEIRNDNTLHDDAVLYYARKAAGGAAAVCVGECQIDPPRSSRAGPCIDMSDYRSTFFMEKIADAVARRGAIPSAELQHAGIYGASGLGPSRSEVDGRVTPAMTPEDVLAAIKAYADAAVLAKSRGFEMVTVHGGHGWLPQQFFSPFINKRGDEWGGNAENRARFAVAICDEIHRSCGANFPVEFRISATEFDSGYGTDEGIKYARALDGHADIIHVSVGIHGSLSNDDWLTSSPTIFSPEGANVPYAAEIKKHVKTSLVAAVGSLTDPGMMEEIIASGKADFVAAARGLLCDPDLPNKARRGQTEDIRVCLRCMTCWSDMFSGGIHCAINPETSREAETTFTLPPARKRKVLIAGGGVAGMQAALTAAENGHRVILCEKTARLGGVMNCEREAPFKKHIDGYIKYQERRLAQAGVEIRLNTEITGDAARDIDPDAIVAALGAVPTVPNIAGIGAGNVMSAQEAFREPERVGRRAVVIGAGLAGCELSVYLTGLGREVSVVEMGADVNAEAHRTQGTVVKKEMRRLGVPAVFNTVVTGVTPEGVECGGPDGKRSIPADTVIYAVGQTPLADEALALHDLAPEFYIIGDCFKVRTIGVAVKTAYTAARCIGRY
jgi:2,4-dienoyl-CoA reductase-like NADH-dependent reductase (Old Yellow Enzyme family)/NADPH-dependent 2,4-dienoyl-CoA reductase/sulfur reductase-like enzyme